MKNTNTYFEKLAKIGHDFEEKRTAHEAKKQQIIDRRLAELQQRYGLDFAGHMDDILHGGVLHKTIEYMRRHYRD